MWDLVLPRLERRHTVLTPALLGHLGGPPLQGPVDMEVVADAVERELDAAGIETAHLVGNSLGGFVALQLAARGRAQSVVALAPAGGWPRGHAAQEETREFFVRTHELLRDAGRYAVSIASTPQGRRSATAAMTVNYEHIPVETVTQIIRGAADCPAAIPFLDYAAGAAWELDAQRIGCPVRIVWGTEDVLLPYPLAASRFKHEWLPHADWIELDGVGHCPQLDVPLETAELILGFTG